MNNQEKRLTPLPWNSEKVKKVLQRIKKANEFCTVKRNDKELMKQAEDRFRNSVIPECKEVGIPEVTAWGLFYFGEIYLDTVLKKR